LFRNNGNSTFTNVTEDAGVKVWNSWGTAWADYDNDGDLDEGSSYPETFYEVRLFRNDGTPNNWLKINLEGCWSNRAAVGARVTVTNGTTTQMREVEGGTGTGSSQNSLVLEFGFGNYTGTVDVSIRWPSGLVQDIAGVTLNQTLDVTEMSCLVAPPTVSAELSGTMHQDVRVAWTPSVDEGSPYFSNYAVYRGTAYNKYGKGYVFITSTPSGTTEFMDVGTGHGDPNTYFYYVQANSTTGFGAKSKAQAAKFTRFLDQGINLLSVPVLTSDWSLDSVLKTVSWDKVWTYDSWDTARQWKMDSIYKPYRGLQAVGPTAGVWVNVLSADYFTVAGIVPEEIQISLLTGWNLVGFPSFMADYYVSRLIIETSCGRVEAFNQTDAPFYLKKLLPSDLMMAGHAYWLKIPADTTWTVRT
jgi:hypothetical protein